MTTNFNLDPYYDDYNEDDKYLRILFRPGYPIQARELTQLQTILQNQVTRLGNSLYQTGDKISGSISYNGNLPYVKLQTFYGTTFVSDTIQDFVGKKVIGSVTNLEALVVHATEGTETDPPTLYLAYTNTGTSDAGTKYSVFLNNEELVSVNESLNRKAYSATQSATGFGSGVSITECVYYINGFLVKVDAQTIILEKYNTETTAGNFIPGKNYTIATLGTTDFTAIGASSNTIGLRFPVEGVGSGTGTATMGPSYRVGLIIQESFVTPEEDSNLFDNAQGSSNYAAPGAHRYKIDAKLAKFGLQENTGFLADGSITSDSGFIQIIKVEFGDVDYKVKNANNSEIYDTLARRTFDESGNYTVRPFPIQVLEHRNNFRGTWSQNSYYVIGDIVRNTEGTYYVARNTGTSTTTMPTHKPPFISTAPVVNDNGTVGIWWEYSDPTAIPANKGFYSPEDGGDENKVLVTIGKGKAYVEGVEIEKTYSSRLEVDKSRTFNRVLNGSISTAYGNYILITNIYGTPDLTAFSEVQLQNTAATRGTSAGSNTKVGTARIRGLELADGKIGSTTAVYKASLFDIKMSTGITDILVTEPGSGYLTETEGAYTVTFETPPGGVAATGKVIVADGSVVAVTITYPGLGYENLPNPTVTISNPASGTTAIVEVTVGQLDFNKVVKRLYASSPTTFTSDISFKLNRGVGTISNIGPNPSSTYEATHLLIGNGTAFTAQLKPGDTIVSSVNKEEATIVYVADATHAYIKSNLSAGISEESFIIKGNPIYDSNATSLLFTIPYTSIRNVRGADDTTVDTTTFVTKKFPDSATSITSSSAGGGLQHAAFDTGSDDISFVDPVSSGDLYDNDRNYFITDTSGHLITPTNIVVSENHRVVTITWSDTTVRHVQLVATVSKSSTSAREKLKTLIPNCYNDRVLQANVYNETTPITRIVLDKADVYRIVRISQGGTNWGTYDASSEIDITDNYTLDDGQRDTHYDYGAIVLKNGRSQPSGPIRIWFEYFEHSALGDYFSVNSYSGLNYKDIPHYKGISLTDQLDFRPRKNDPSWAGGEPSGSETDTGFGSLTYPAPNLPKRGYNIIASYSYYNMRRDIVQLSRDGILQTITGIPAIDSDSKFPEPTGSNSMLLYKLTFEPFTLDVSSKNIIVDTIDNRRYTMRDIGALDRRISDLEEYTRLSLLERAAASTQITDPSAMFNNRLKAGLITDTFDKLGVGNLTAPDYRIAIDTINSELRPMTLNPQVNLVELADSKLKRRQKNYMNCDDVIMLQYADELYIDQPLASRTSNINPFASFTFIGNLDLNPPTDEWVDIENIDITVLDETEKRTLTSIANDSINPVTGQKGLLGNYYGAWQQVATGVKRTDVGGQYRVGRRRSGEIRHDEVTANQLQNVRTLYTTEVKLIGQTTPVLTEDKVTSSSIIPFIRSRPIVFVGKGIKPDTDLNAYFDDIAVSDFVTPATKLTYTLNSSTPFDDVSAVGSASRELARRGLVDNNTVLAYNKGDVIYVSKRGSTTYNSAENSVATAVVAFAETRTDNGRKVLHIVNINGTFTAGDTIIGTVSGATGEVYSQVTPSKLTTNKSGQVAGVFVIPNDAKMKFKCGSRIFRLSDQATSAASKTRAEKTYLASGVKETHNRTFSSVGHYEIATRELTEKGDYVWVQDRSTLRTVVDGYYDPLAETFMVADKDIMLTKIDVYFKTKDSNIPVRIEVRETDNGYPSKVILPFSQLALAPEDVVVSDDASLPTSFVFKTPISLKAKTEYSFVLLSDCQGYEVWLARQGDEEISTGRLINDQPYNGVMFKSQNGSTWTAEQTEDLKFKIYRAKFDTNVIAYVDLINDHIPTQKLLENPFRTTADSSIVEVTQHSHGFYGGVDTSYVQFTVPSTSVYAGIPAASFNSAPLKIQTVIDRNKYTVDLGVNANLSILCGGKEDIYATTNAAFNEIHPIINELVLPNTAIEYTMNTLSGKTLGSSEVPYQFDEGFVDVIPNENNYFMTTRLIASETNEKIVLNNAHSIILRAKMYTTDDYVSPMLDLHRTSCITVENIIDNDTDSIYYVDESEPHTGSATAKYLTKKINLQTPATGIYVAFQLNLPPEASISVWYRVGKSSDGDLFDLHSWTPMIPVTDIETIKTDNYDLFTEAEYQLDSIESFDAFQVKLVMRSSSSSNVPRVKELKVIGLV